ncbi:trypsin-like peptidase domain-containing protein [Longispora sp. K20-0274]|uniref:metallophosphoesterase family protein n=1 Tax=Longispora sp. K20-0274 TaxID=3088255 RepID=UPI00399A967D
MVVPFRVRLVQVLQNVGTDSAQRWVSCSGLRIGRGLVLTSGHGVVGGRPIIARVLGLTEDDPVEERVAELAIPGGPELDIALLRLADDRDDDLPPMRFARILRDESHPDTVACHVVGFPQFKTHGSTSGDIRSEVAHVWGRLGTLDGSRFDTLTLHVDRYPPLDGQAAGVSPYQGMSGAALVVGDQVLGVVASHVRVEGHALEVVPLTRLRDRADWAEALGIDLRALPRAVEADEVPTVFPLPPTPRRRFERRGAILVLSDLWRIAPTGAEVVTAARELVRDLNDLRTTHGLAPDLVAVPGGTARNAAASDYARSGRLLSEICERLGIPPARVVMTPGVQDVNASAYREYFRECRQNRVEPELPYWPKWAPFVNEFATVLGPAGFRAERPWSWLEVEAQGVAVAAINSTFAETPESRSRRGHFGDGQLDWFRERLERRRADGWLCVGVLHDSPTVTDQAATLADRDLVAFHSRLAPLLDLVLHGRPAPFHKRVAFPDGRTVLAPSAVRHGSYQLVDLRRGMAWGRALVNGAWAVDPDIGTTPRKGYRQISIPLQ